MSSKDKDIPKIIIGSIYLAFSLLLFSLGIKGILKNKKNIFLSIRSSNILQVSNAAFFLCNVILGITVLLIGLNKIDETNIYMDNFYIAVFTFIPITLACKYQRILQSSKLDFYNDDTSRFKKFQSLKSSFEYFYIRILLISSFLLFVLALIVSYFKKDLSPFHDDNLTWSTIFFIETLMLIMYGFFIFKKQLNIYIRAEYIALLTVQIITFFICLIIKLKNLGKNSLCPLIPINSIYILIVDIITIIFPLLYSKKCSSTIIYPFTSELLKDFYLFMTNRDCYMKFLKFIKQQQNRREATLFYLDLYNEISKYRMIYLTDSENSENEARRLLSKYFDKNNLSRNKIGVKEEVANNVNHRCQDLLSKGKTSLDMFEDALKDAFLYLKEIFNNFKKSDEFEELVVELNYNTYLRCKLLQCGMLKK